MKQLFNFSILVLLATLSSCIGDDFLDDYVEPDLRITNPIDTLEAGTTFQFETAYFNNVGKEEAGFDVVWSSSDTSILSIDQTGLATGKVEGGPVTITAETTAYDVTATDQMTLFVGETTVVPVVVTRTGTVNTTSSYPLFGDFELIDDDGDLRLTFADNYVADTALPGLFVYLSNNPDSFAGAYEIGAVQIFQGAHTYDLPDNIGVYDYEYVLYFCKPFVAKVGHGLIN